MRLLPLLCLLFASPALATLDTASDLDTLLARADDVVWARAVEQHVETDPRTGYHYTVTAFAVIDAAKGTLRAGEPLELRLIGGRAPGSAYSTVVADVPRFVPGEEVVLFTRTRGERRLLVDRAGVLRVRDGRVDRLPPRAAAGIETVPLRASAVRRAGDPPGRQEPTRSAPPPRAPLTPPRLLEQLREIAP